MDAAVANGRIPDVEAEAHEAGEILKQVFPE
jgi:hypothetical protein